MLDPVVNVEVAEVDRVVLVAPGEESSHIIWHKVAERWREIVRFPDLLAHHDVRNIPTITRKNA